MILAGVLPKLWEICLLVVPSPVQVTTSKNLGALRNVQETYSPGVVPSLYLASPLLRLNPVDVIVVSWEVCPALVLLESRFVSCSVSNRICCLAAFLCFI